MKETSCILLACALLLSPAAMAADEKKAAKAPPEAPHLAILAEYFLVEHADLTGLLREHGDQADATALRESLGSMVKEKKAELIETMWVSTLSGQRAKVESVK